MCSKIIIIIIAIIIILIIIIIIITTVIIIRMQDQNEGSNEWMKGDGHQAECTNGWKPELLCWVSLTWLCLSLYWLMLKRDNDETNCCFCWNFIKGVGSWKIPQNYMKEYRSQIPIQNFGMMYCLCISRTALYLIIHKIMFHPVCPSLLENMKIVLTLQYWTFFLVKVMVLVLILVLILVTHPAKRWQGS